LKLQVKHLSSITHSGFTPVLEMFALSFVALVLANTAAAGPLKRYNGLSVSLTGPAADVSSLDELKFSASVTNNGAEDIKVLKYGTILDSELPTRSFTVTKEGAEIAFTGIRVTLFLLVLKSLTNSLPAFRLSRGCRRHCFRRYPCW